MGVFVLVIYTDGRDDDQAKMVDLLDVSAFDSWRCICIDDCRRCSHHTSTLAC